MPKTLADLRKSDHVGLPERSYPICVAGKLLAQLEDLDEEFRQAVEAEESATTRKRLSEKSKARQIAEQMETLRDEMDEHTVHVTVRAVDSEVWRAWCAANPAREGNNLDTRTFLSICNADALLAAVQAGQLSEQPLVVALNGDKPTDGDWDFVWSNAVHGDRIGLAKLVASMHESSVDVPKSRLAWLRELRNETDSE